MIYSLIKYDGIVVSYYKSLIRKEFSGKHIIMRNFLRKHEDLKNFLDYQFLCICPVKDRHFKYSTKIFWILHDVTKFPTCKNPNCSNLIIADCSIDGKFEKERCSKKCVSTDPNIKKQKENTCLAKFGTKHMFQSELFKKESTETCLKKYGKTFYVQTNEFKEKSKMSCIEHYGVEYASQSKEFQKSIVNTALKKYNVSHWTKNDSFKEKQKRYFLEKYGVDNPLKTEKVRNKIKASFIKKFNGPSPFSSEKVKEKFKNTCLLKYGCVHPNQNPNIRKRGQHKYSYNNIKFDSAPELALYIFLSDNHISFEYQPSVSFKYAYNGKEHIYIPDFKIEDSYYEIKGDHFFDKNKMINPWNQSLNGLMEAKHKCMLENKVTILKHEQYGKYLDYVKEQYGKNFLKGLKQNANH